MAETMRDLKRRMKSIESTEHITNAMRLVSAAKFRRAKALYDRKSQQLQEVSDTIEGILAEGAGVNREGRGAEAAAGPERVLAIVISSSRGLCGGFNSSLIKTARQALEPYEKEKVRVFCIGSRGGDFFAHADYAIAGSFDGAPEKIAFSEIEAISTPILADYQSHKLDKVPADHNGIYQFPAAGAGWSNSCCRQSLRKPGKQKERRQCRQKSNHARSKEQCSYMLPKYFELTLFKAVIESAVCEHAARRTAMESATDNAREILSSLSLSYNRMRQAEITDELIEIVSGAETQK